MMTSSVAPLLDVVLLLEEINISPGTWHMQLLSNALLSLTINKIIRSSFSADKANNCWPHCSIEILQSYPVI